TDGIKAVDAELTPRQPDGQNLVKAVTVLYGQNPDAFETGPHVAHVVIDLLSAEVRSGTTDEIIASWRKRTGDIPDVIALTFTEAAIGPGGRAIDLRLMGDDLDQLKRAATEFKAYLAGFKGVFDLSDDLRPGKPEVTIALKQGASALGFDSRMIALQLQAAFQGVKVDDLQIGPESYEIEVRTTSGARDELADLDRFTLIGPGGDLVPLEAVAVIEKRRSWGRINRVNGRRAVGIIGDVNGKVANANEIIREAQTNYLPGLIARYPGIDYAVEGQNKQGAITSASILRNIGFGLIGVYLLLAFQFRSYFAPVIVMAVIPSSVVGAFLGHWLMGINLSMPSIVGVASLAGVVVNNSILLVQFMDGARARGETAKAAAGEASRRRFRPIVLTTATTIAGLIPLLSETSLQAQVLIP
ncbi:MAG: efflux RND transporter permease subunit, partial [Hyphomicrobiales bacterium]|nr:efflux RND transporter permease subunit [Hyphomicrobiales bacterium]